MHMTVVVFCTVAVRSRRVVSLFSLAWPLSCDTGVARAEENLPQLDSHGTKV